MTDNEFNAIKLEIQKDILFSHSKEDIYKMLLNALGLIDRTKLESKKYRGKCQLQKKELALFNEQINRQKAEIERLQNGIEELNCKLDMANDAKAEAIKEFWQQRPPQLNPNFKGKEQYNKGMRDRLIELLYDTLQDWECDVSNQTLTEIAEHLLDNGVIVTPCVVGDRLYDIYEANANGYGDIREMKVTEIKINLDKRNKPWLIISGYYFAFEDFGKTVFLTKEEAEKALKERDGNG